LSSATKRPSNAVYPKVKPLTRDNQIITQAIAIIIVIIMITTTAPSSDLLIFWWYGRCEEGESQFGPWGARIFITPKRTFLTQTAN